MRVNSSTVRSARKVRKFVISFNTATLNQLRVVHNVSYFNHVDYCQIYASAMIRISPCFLNYEDAESDVELRPPITLKRHRHPGPGSDSFPVVKRRKTSNDEVLHSTIPCITQKLSKHETSQYLLPLLKLNAHQKTDCRLHTESCM